MALPSRVPGWFAAMIAALLCSSGADAAAEKPSAEKPTGASEPVAIFPGTSSKEPISIDANKLVYYDKERKAVYSGNVVVIQGDTKMTCSAMTVFLDRAPTKAPSSVIERSIIEWPIHPHHELRCEAPGCDRAGHRPVQNSSRHWR